MPIARSCLFRLFRLCRESIAALTLLLTALGNPVVAQSRHSDSISYDMRVDIHNVNFGIRTVLGVQGSFYYDIGLARTSLTGSTFAMESSSLYAAFTMFPTIRRGETTAIGFRIGAECFSNILLLGLEGTSLYTSENSDMLIAPKVGIGMPDFNIFYSYNFSTNNWSVGRVAKNNVGASFTLPIRTHDKLHHKWYWFTK